MSSAVPSVPWHEFTTDPRTAEAAPLRASDRDRDVISGVLGDAYADGRLTREEYDDRLACTISARTLGELPPMVADLVPAVPVPASREAAALADSDGLRRQAVARFEAQRRQALLGFLVPTLICWTVWVIASLSGGGSWDPHFPWPLFVMLGTGGNALRVLLHKQALIAEEQRRLERRLEKRLAKQQRRQLEGPGADPSAEHGG